jgi:uroporphyrinogen-III decarboxylase
MKKIKQFVSKEQFAVQAWSAFGMDGIVWLTGAENAVMMAMDYPVEFGRLATIIANTDLERTELALSDQAVDLIVQRGWYSSTDFWSPELFDRFVVPHVRELANLVHRHGRLLAYVMTTGIEVLAQKLVDAGVDVLYFVDPIELSKKNVGLDELSNKIGERATLVGGISTLTLATQSTDSIEKQLVRAVQALSNTNRFILHPVDALFPDTPWEGVEKLIRLWKKICTPD